MSPAERRKVVVHVRNSLGADKVTERWGCRVPAQPRSTPHIPDDELRMIELAPQYGRYKYRPSTGMLREEGWKVNHKRIECRWRWEGLRIPQK